MKWQHTASVMVFALAQLAWAEPPSPSQVPAPVTREELARAYLRFERVMHDHPPSEEGRAAINRAFDAVTLKFFGLQLADATRDLNELTLSLLPATLDKASYRLAWSLATVLEPAEIKSGMQEGAIVLRGMYPIKSAEPLTLWTELRIAGEPMTNVQPRLQKVVLPPDGVWSQRLPLNEKHLTGDTHLIVSFSADELVEERRFLIPRDDPASFASEFINRLDSIKNVRADDPAFDRAKAIFKERVGLLSGTHSSLRAAEFLLNPATHHKSLYLEAKLLTSGVNPYSMRPGDTYRPVIPSAPQNRPIACRVVAPAHMVKGKPIPLVVAFHGAGGDETMFVEAYGCGMLKDLAYERGFVLASVASGLNFTPAAFDALVEQVSADYPIDPQRICLIGHSMGAGVVSELARERPKAVAGVVCFAGGRFGAAPSSPVLLFAGQLDPIVDTGKLVANAEAARQAGAPVEIRVVADCGHTLLVGHKLPEAVDWLLEKRSAPAGIH